jgi:hypothetical protein
MRFFSTLAARTAHALLHMALLAVYYFIITASRCATPDLLSVLLAYSYAAIWRQRHLSRTRRHNKICDRECRAISRAIRLTSQGDTPVRLGDGPLGGSPVRTHYNAALRLEPVCNARSEWVSASLHASSSARHGWFPTSGSAAASKAGWREGIWWAWVGPRSNTADLHRPTHSLAHSLTLRV